MGLPPCIKQKTSKNPKSVGAGDEAGDGTEEDAGAVLDHRLNMEVGGGADEEEGEAAVNEEPPPPVSMRVSRGVQS